MHKRSKYCAFFLYYRKNATAFLKNTSCPVPPPDAVYLFRTYPQIKRTPIASGLILPPPKDTQNNSRRVFYNAPFPFHYGMFQQARIQAANNAAFDAHHDESIPAG